MKNVLFIVYYFPPMGGSGVQRPLKFVKYLRNFGWNPIILCPEPGIYPYFDQSLSKELEEISQDLIRIPVKTPFHLGQHFAGEGKELRIPDWLSKIGRRALRLFMYPDNKKAWIEPAVQKGLSVIEEQDIDLIFSTAPPFSNFVAAAEISRRSELPLVLDYRDLWSDNHFMDDMFSWQKRKMQKMEAKCLQQASAVTGLDQFMLHRIAQNHPKSTFQSFVISHGYDPEDFTDNSIPPSFDRKESKLNFLYSGLFYEQNQPDIFLRAIKKAISDGTVDQDKIHLHFQGGLDQRIRSLIKDLQLSKQVTDYGYLTHKVAVRNLLEADILWMISNFQPSHKQVKSGKLFEYIGTGKPILGLLHKGASSDLLKAYGAGFIGNLKSVDKIAETIGAIYSKWESGNLPEADNVFMRKFDRKKLTGELAQIFDKISSQ